MASVHLSSPNGGRWLSQRALSLRAALHNHMRMLQLPVDVAAHAPPWTHTDALTGCLAHIPARVLSEYLPLPAGAQLELPDTICSAIDAVRRQVDWTHVGGVGLLREDRLSRNFTRAHRHPVFGDLSGQEMQGAQVPSIPAAWRLISLIQDYSLHAEHLDISGLVIFPDLTVLASYQAFPSAHLRAVLRTSGSAADPALHTLPRALPYGWFSAPDPLALRMRGWAQWAGLQSGYRVTLGGDPELYPEWSAHHRSLWLLEQRRMITHVGVPPDVPVGARLVLVADGPVLVLGIDLPNHVLDLLAITTMT